MDTTGLAIAFAKALFLFLLVFQAVPILSWVERRGAAFIQHRVGPNRVNIAGVALFGLVQPLADAVKFLWKEDYVPGHANRRLYLLAPAILLIPASMTFAVIPFGDTVEVAGRTVNLVIADLNVGILYLFALTSLSVYGIALAGWASNNKYSLMGGLRSAAQMVSYELALGLSVVPLLMIYGSFELDEIVRRQGETIAGVLPKWGIVTQPLAAVLFTIAIFAETNRLPFDLPEAESELVVGYHTEYSSMKFAMFMMAEYMAMVTGSMLIVTLFLGGWQVPFFSSAELVAAVGSVPAALLQFGSFSTKLGALLAFFVWVRWTLPRFRYDQLMGLGWKAILPLALVNLFLTGMILFFVR